MNSTLLPGTIAIRCRDMAACIPFYRQLLGDEIASLCGRGASGPYHMAWFALGSDGRFVLTDDCHMHPAAGLGGAHLLMADTDAEDARLRAMGIVPTLPTHDTKGGRVLVLVDPDGNEIIIGTREQLPNPGTKLPF